ncbi:unnamed protein product [Closterium sp. NIES-53]
MSGLLLLVGSAAAARARVAGVVEVAAGVVMGAAVEVVEVVEVVAAMGVVAGVGALVAVVVAAVGAAVVVAVGVVAVGVELFRGDVLVVASGSSSSVRARPLRPNNFRAEFGDEAEHPRWAELLRSGVAIFDFDYDAIIAAMYALSVSAEGDCYLYVPPYPSIEAAALGASESALRGTAPAEALHAFTLDSGASRCFFHDSTTLTPLSAPIPVRVADPLGVPVLARSSTALPCPAVPSSSLSLLHLPSFSMNLVSTAALQDAMATTTTPGGQRVSICMCTRTGRHLATLTRRPGSSLYTLTAEPPQVAASAQVSVSGPVAAPCSCRLVSHQTLLWHHRLGHPSLPRLRGMHSRLLVSRLPRSLSPLLLSPALPCLPCVEGRQRAAPHSSSFPLITTPLQTFHMDVWGPARVSGKDRERYFLLVVDNYTRYTTVFPLRSKGEDLSFLRLHSDRGGEFSSDLLGDFCRGEGILQSFTLSASPQQNGVAQRRHRSSDLVMEVARRLHDPCGCSPFSVAVCGPVRCALAQPLAPCLFAGNFADTALDGEDPVEPVEVAVDSGAAGGGAIRGTKSAGAEPAGAGSGGTESACTKPGVAECESAEPGGAEPERAEPGGAEPGGAEPERTQPGGTLATGGPPGALLRRESLSPPQLCEWFARRIRRQSGAAGAGGSAVGGIGALGPGGTGAVGAGGAIGVGAGGTGARAAGGTGAAGPGGARSGGTGAAGAGGAAGVGAGGTGAGAAGGTRAGAAGGTGAADPGVPLPPPLASSLPAVLDPESDLVRAASPTVPHLLATVATDPSFESAAASALVAELVDFAAACRLDYAASLVAESESDCSLSIGVECALGTDVLEDRQEDFECITAAVPHLVSMLIAPEGDPDAPDIPTPRSYAEAVTGPYSSNWQTAMDTKMASWKMKRRPGSPPAFKARYVARGFSQRQGVDFFQTFSPTPKMTTLRVLLHVTAQSDYELHSLDFNTSFLQGSLHEEIWLRRPLGFTESFPAGTQWSLWRPVYDLCQVPREWHDTLRTTLAALGFAPSTAHSSLFLRTDTSLLLFYVLVYVDDLVFATVDTEALALVKSELQKRHTCSDLGELRNYLGLQITRDRARRTITLTQSHMVHQVLQPFGFRYCLPQSTPLPTGHSLSAPPSDESVEPSGPYPELVGCLMYLMICTRPDLAYPLSILARYVAPGRHRLEHWEDAQRVLRYLCSTSGMGLVLGGWGPVVLTGHADASWVDDLATQRSSSCEAEIYVGAMAAQELCWLTYLLTDLGEAPRSPPVLYVDNKAMLALCREHRLEHRTKHSAMRYFPERSTAQNDNCEAELLSAKGDCYLCVPPDPGIEAAALGNSVSVLPGTAPAEALHTFTLDSGALRCFFRDSTTLTPLSAPVPVRLVDPSGGPVLARSSTMLPWRAVPSGSLTRLHLPSFSTNLVSTAALKDAMVTTTTPGGQRVSICTCTRTGRHLATFTRRPGSGLYTLATEPRQVAASAQVSSSGPVAPPCSCRLLSHQTLLWHHRLGHPSLPRLRGMHSRLLVSGLPRSLPPLPPSPAPPCLPCVEGQQRAAPHSSSFPPMTAPLQTLHMDVWGPARVSGQGREHYILLVVDDYTRYTTVFPLRSKGEVVDVLIPWIRAVSLQLRERFRQDLPVLRLHSDRGGEFSSDLLRDFCRGEGIL